MKKTALLLVIIMLLSNATSVLAHQRITPELSPLIRMYKEGNYTECYKKLSVLAKKDSTNALLYYYLGMTSAQLGKKDEAVDNYDKAVFFAAPESNLYRYSLRGKACVEGLPACSESDNNLSTDSAEDAFMKSTEMFSDEVRSEYEKLKLENFMREINRGGEITPAKFNEFRNFSGMNNPSDLYSQIIAGYNMYNTNDVSLLSDVFDDKDYNNSDNELTDLALEIIE